MMMMQHQQHTLRPQRSLGARRRLQPLACNRRAAAAAAVPHHTHRQQQHRSWASCAPPLAAAPTAAAAAARRRPELRLVRAAGGDGGGAAAGGDWRGAMRFTAVSLLLCNVHRNTFSVLLPQLSSSLALTPSQAGTIQAASLFTYLLGQLPAGRLADSLSGTRVMVVGLAAWSAATALTGVPLCAAASGAAWVLPLLLLARALMGLASAAAMPAVTATSAQLVPQAERASAVAGAYALFNIGGVLGLAAIPPLALALGLPGAFFVTGAAGVGWAALGGRSLLGGQKQAAAAGAGKAAAAAAGGAAAAAAAAGGSKGLAWLAALPRDTLVQLGVLCYSHAVMGYSFFILQNWIPTFLAALLPPAASSAAATGSGGGSGLALMGSLSALPWVAAAVAGPAAGRVANHLIKQRGWSTLSVRRLMQSASLLGCAASVLPLALVPSPSVTLATACLTGALALYALSAAGFHSHLQDVAGANAGLVFGVTNSVSIGAGIGGNLLTGVVLEAAGSPAAVFGLLAALNVTAALLFQTATSSRQLVL